MEFMAGTAVRVVEFGGKVLERRVLADKGDRVVICPEDEFQAASRECRVPVGISFPKSSVTVRSCEG